MAFSKTPTGDTYNTKTVPLLYQWDSRDNALNGYDTLLENALVEPIGSEYFQVIKREGCETLPWTSVGSVLGVYFWQGNTDPWMVVVTMQNGGSPLLEVVDIANWTTAYSTGLLSTGAVNPGDDVYFQEFLYQNGNKALMIAVGGRLSMFVDPN